MFFGHTSLDPFGTFGDRPRRTQLQAIEELAPTVLVSFDLLWADALPATGAAMTGTEEVTRDLGILIPRLGATGAEVFLGDVPDVTGLPSRSVTQDPSEQAEVRQRIGEYNAALAAAAEPFDNVHIVGLADALAEIREQGVRIGEEDLDLSMFGGLLSFDGLHFGTTGYGVLAQLFADAITAETGVDLPPVDLPHLLAEDIHSPTAVREAGGDPGACRARPQ